jgi:hypothetical protein
MRGRFFTVGRSQAIVTYHPAYLLRNPGKTSSCSCGQWACRLSKQSHPQKYDGWKSVPCERTGCLFESFQRAHHLLQGAHQRGNGRGGGGTDLPQRSNR